jgi:hypothetical protein
VQTVNIDDPHVIRSHYQVPEMLQSCHTAIVDGYVLEGHVPVPEIRRLLGERPEGVGLVVPRMPIGAPGMEIEGFAPQPYKVLLFKQDGSYEVYKDYPEGGP